MHPPPGAASRSIVPRRFPAAAADKLLRARIKDLTPPMAFQVGGGDRHIRHEASRELYPGEQGLAALLKPALMAWCSRAAKLFNVKPTEFLGVNEFLVQHHPAAAADFCFHSCPLCGRLRRRRKIHRRSRRGLARFRRWPRADRTKGPLFGRVILDYLAVPASLTRVAAPRAESPATSAFKANRHRHLSGARRGARGDALQEQEGRNG